MNSSPQPADSSASGPAWRWWGLAIGTVFGILDTLGMQALGVSFTFRGENAILWVIPYFASSFAAFGYLVGLGIEQRRRQQEVASLLQSQMETINSTRARLIQSEKLAVLGQLAAQIAHEVRNPLGVIRSAAQGLGETVAVGKPDAEKACAFILAEIDRLNSVITSLLAFARPLQIEARAVAVADLFERALLLARDDLAAKQIRVARGDTATLPRIEADTDLMSQVLLDLLHNAAEAVPAAGEVRLEAEAAGETVRIRVSDSGPGVPAELRGRIFEPFFTTRQRGTGLGLAIARQIVQAHGGQIAVGDGAAGGACFTISLPTRGGASMAAA
jgi:two-component system sensor histidine kinase HydH